jgi:hypothetical protein
MDMILEESGCARTPDLVEQFEMNADSALALNLDPDDLMFIDNQED